MAGKLVPLFLTTALIVFAYSAVIDNVINEIPFEEVFENPEGSESDLATFEKFFEEPEVPVGPVEHPEISVRARVRHDRGTGGEWVENGRRTGEARARYERGTGETRGRHGRGMGEARTGYRVRHGRGTAGVWARRRRNKNGERAWLGRSTGKARAGYWRRWARSSPGQGTGGNGRGTGEARAGHGQGMSGAKTGKGQGSVVERVRHRQGTGGSHGQDTGGDECDTDEAQVEQGRGTGGAQSGHGQGTAGVLPATGAAQSEHGQGTGGNSPGTGEAPNCAIGMNNGDVGSRQPLFVKTGTLTIEQPSSSGFLNVDKGKTIDLYCTSKFAAPLSGKKVTAACDGGSNFIISGTKLKIQNVVCTSAVARTARSTGISCTGGGTFLEIGISLEPGFIRTIEVCHNLAKEVTLYSRYNMSSTNVAFQKSPSRACFTTGTFYGGKDVNKIYAQVTQQQTFAKILGAGSTKYFDINKNVYLARGHLAAKADFVYAPEQLATFFYINTAPQWQTFNGANWERVEDGVKKFAQTRNANFDIITGTWGVSTLPDVKGIQQPLYLNFSANGQGLIPVPKLYYRVVIDKATRHGIVIIGVNNPHITLDEIKKDYIICNDVSSKITWISWDKNNIQRGYSYACEVNEFASKIGELPSLSVSELLY